MATISGNKFEPSAGEVTLVLARLPWVRAA